MSIYAGRVLNKNLSDLLPLMDVGKSFYRILDDTPGRFPGYVQRIQSRGLGSAQDELAATYDQVVLDQYGRPTPESNYVRLFKEPYKESSLLQRAVYNHLNPEPIYNDPYRNVPF
jgi:hypothetical protein